MRSVSWRVEDGLPVPALTTTRRFMVSGAFGVRVSQSVAQLLELLDAEGAGHDLRDVVAVAQADVALGARAGLGEADAAGAAVVGVGDALDEAGGLEPRDEARDAGLGRAARRSPSSVIRRPSGAVDSA